MKIDAWGVQKPSASPSAAPLCCGYAFRKLACCVVLLLGSSVVPLTYGAEDTGMELGWNQASRYLFQESYKLFRKLEKTGGPHLRSARLGEALSLLNLQPKTQGNIQQAADIFSSLAGQNPSDEIGITAQYY